MTLHFFRGRFETSAQINKVDGLRDRYAQVSIDSILLTMFYFFIG